MRQRLLHTWAQRKPKLFLFWFSIITLVAYQFYQGAFMNAFLLKMCNSILVAFLVIYIFRNWSKNCPQIPLYNEMRWLTLSTFFSIIMAYIFKGQPVEYTFTVMARMDLLLVIFFLLWKWQPRITSLEKYILIFGILYIVLWLYAMYKAPELTFGHVGEDGEYNDSRGIARINFIGRGNLIMAFFLCLNRYKETIKTKWLLFAAVFFIFLVMQVTRQLILWAFLVGIIYLLWNNKKLCVLAVGTFLAFYLFISPNLEFSDDSVIGSMINLTESQAESQSSGDENIRITEYKYFFTEWHTNPITMIFGTGVPHGATHFGGWYTKTIQELRGLYLSDVGYPSMYATLGIIGLALYLIIYIRAARMKMPRQLAYARLWFIFMIPANIAAQWYNKADFIILSVVCLYIIGLTKMNKDCKESRSIS